MKVLSRIKYDVQWRLYELSYCWTSWTINQCFNNSITTWSPVVKSFVDTTYETIFASMYASSPKRAFGFLPMSPLRNNCLSKERVRHNVRAMIWKKSSRLMLPFLFANRRRKISEVLRLNLRSTSANALASSLAFISLLRSVSCFLNTLYHVFISCHRRRNSSNSKQPLLSSSCNRIMLRHVSRLNLYSPSCWRKQFWRRSRNSNASTTPSSPATRSKISSNALSLPVTLIRRLFLGSVTISRFQ